MASETFKPTPTSKQDYLDEDPPIRGQNYVCLSFLSPEDILADKQVFLVEKFIQSLSKDLNTLFQGLATKFPENKELLDSIRETQSHFFKGGEELQDAFRFFKNINSAELEDEFHKANQFRTSVRGIKVRGVFDTVEEARTRADVLKRMGDKFDIFVGQVGVWCPWSPNPQDLKDQEYTESALNELMKEYQTNMTVREQVFEERKAAKIKDAAEKVEAAKKAAAEEKAKELAAEAAANPASDAAAAMNEGVDPWLASRGITVTEETKDEASTSA